MTEKEQFLVDEGNLITELEKFKYNDGHFDFVDIGWEDILKILVGCRVAILHPDKIRAAIKECDLQEKSSKSASDVLAGDGQKAAARGELRVAGQWRQFADLLRYVLGEDQDTWSDAELLGKK